MGFVDTLSPFAQIEATYIGWYNRAGDNPGVAYWENQPLTLSQVFESFSVQAEAASLPTDLGTLINQVYQNLFNRGADSAGLAYWEGQLQSGAVNIGAAVVAIANGAQGSDQNVLTDKIAAAEYFTLVTAPPATAGVDGTTIIAAHNAVTSVHDAASVHAAEEGTQLFVDIGVPPGVTEPPLIGQALAAIDVHVV